MTEPTAGKGEQQRRARVTGPLATLHGMPLRCALAAIVMVPAATLTVRLGQPYAISAIASTTAIVLHAPVRYHQRPQRILWCYAVGIGIALPITLVGAAVHLPTLLACAVAAVVIAASPAGRIHPPSVCIALAITAPGVQPLMLLDRWCSFTALALVCLAALWLLTAKPLVREARQGVQEVESSCATT
jgi:hypothetical protein